ncbi:MAG: hypothetical protein H7Y18_07230 [Clostridiaceae bacterium]|nr:hypothetical protein [Clostridiaceae bacterium]
MMNCKSFNKNLKEYLENDTTIRTSDQMNEHKKHCENCKRLYNEKLEVRISLEELFNLDSVSYTSQSQEIISKLDDKYYSRSVIFRLKYHFRRNILSYSSAMAIAILFIISLPTLKENVVNLKTSNNVPKITDTIISDTIVSDKITVKNSFDIKTAKLNNKTYFYGSLKENVLIETKDGKNIFTYNIKDESSSIIAKVYDSNNILNNVICNSKWIIWVEHEPSIKDTTTDTLTYTVPYKWQIVAQNVATGEKKIIDKCSFTTTNYKTYGIGYIVPTQLSVYNNTLVYCKTEPDNLQVKSELIKVDLNSNIKNIIASTNNVLDEWIHECSIYDNKIIWSKYKERYNKNLESSSEYKFSDLFIYNLNTKTIEQLTFNGHYASPSIYKNKVAAIKFPLRNPGEVTMNTEIAMIDLNSKKIQTIVDENSPCYSKVENDLYRCFPILSDKYLTWKNNFYGNNYIYDYTTNKFIKLVNEVDIKTNQNDVYTMDKNDIYFMDNNYALMYKTSPKTSSTEQVCVFLDTITK